VGSVERKFDALGEIKCKGLNYDKHSAANIRYDYLMIRTMERMRWTQ